MKKFSLLLATLGGAAAGYLFSDKKLREELMNAETPEEAARLLGKHLQKDGKKLAGQMQEFVQSDEVQKHLGKAKALSKKKMDEATKLLKSMADDGASRAKSSAKKGVAKAKTAARKGKKKAVSAAKKQVNSAKKSVKKTARRMKTKTRAVSS